MQKTRFLKKLFFTNAVLLMFAISNSHADESDQVLLSIQPKSVIYYECFTFMKDSNQELNQANKNLFNEFSQPNSKKLIKQYCTEFLNSEQNDNYETVQRILQRLKSLEPNSAVVQLLQFDHELKKKKKPFEVVEQFEKTLIRFRQLSPSFGEAWKAEYRLQNNDVENGFYILSKMPMNHDCRKEYKELLQIYREKKTDFDETLSNYLNCQQNYDVSYDSQLVNEVRTILSMKDELEYTLLEPIDYAVYVYEKKKRELEEAERLRELSKPKETEKERLLRRLSEFSL